VSALRLYDRPTPLRIKSIRELDPGFRPRWVRVGRWALAMSLVLQVLFVLSLGRESMAMPMTFLISACVFGWFWLSPKWYCAVIGLWLRPFSSLAVRFAKFEMWLELHLDWDQSAQGIPNWLRLK
jgi:hypothetical protein